MTARIDSCLTCDEPFAPVDRHPAITSAWCDHCWRTLAERIELGVDAVWWPGRDQIPAMRSDDL